MKSFHSLGKAVWPRAAFLSAMGIVTLAVPDFLLSGIFYALLTGYILLDGIRRILDFLLIFSKGAKTPVHYANLAAGCLLVLFCVHLMGFARYLVHVSPVLLGVLLFAEGAADTVIAAGSATALQKGMLFPIAFATLAAGLAVFVFTFGFGVGGLPGLTKVSGAALLISSAFGPAYWLTCRRPQRLCPERGD